VLPEDGGAVPEDGGVVPEGSVLPVEAVPLPEGEALVESGVESPGEDTIAGAVPTDALPVDEAPDAAALPVVLGGGVLPPAEAVPVDVATGELIPA